MNEHAESETNDRPPFTYDESEFPSAGSGLLMALGVGLAIGVLIHALRPAPKPQQRLASMLEDLEDRLREIGKPAANKVGHLAIEGAHALSSRVHRGEAQLEKFLRNATRQLRKFTS